MCLYKLLPLWRFIIAVHSYIKSYKRCFKMQKWIDLMELINKYFYCYRYYLSTFSWWKIKYLEFTLEVMKMWFLNFSHFIETFIPAHNWIWYLHSVIIIWYLLPEVIFWTDIDLQVNGKYGSMNGYRVGNRC